MSIYSRARTKIVISTVFVCVGIIVGLWLVVFATDYTMFSNGNPMLFAKTTVEQYEDKYITIEKGLGYYAIMNEQNKPVMYLFGHKIK